MLRHFSHLDPARIEALFERPPADLRSLTDPRAQAMALGGVLYSPATRPGLADRFVGDGWAGLTAMAFCLEDSVAEHDLEQAERETHRALELIEAAAQRAGGRAAQPFLFVRVRSADHLERLLGEWGDLARGIDGILLPKIGAETLVDYLPLIASAQRGRERSLWAMPILEGSDIAFKELRLSALEAVLDQVRRHRALIPCVRIGATDLSSQWALRRSRDFTVYDVGVIRDVIADVVNVIGRDPDAPAISGPVWEFIHDEPIFKPRLRETPFREEFGAVEGPELRQELLTNAVDGLLREALLDVANGLHGKTVIHPAHIVPVDATCVLSHDEWITACQIREGAANGDGVSASRDGRMNEPKPHARWAERVLARAESFGVLREGHSFLALLEGV